MTENIIQWDYLPDAIFSSSDYAAIGAMQVLKSNDIEIPEKVAIVGFSNESFTSYTEPPLSTVEQHSKKIGQYAANLFLDIAKKGTGERTATKTVLSPELIIRKSSLKSI